MAAILLSGGILAHNLSPRPLSQMEAQLVGEWGWKTGGSIRIFHPDRSLSTANEQFEGSWSIEGNTLTVEYWQPVRIRDARSFVDFYARLRRSRKTEICKWDIEFSDDGQTHTLIYPENHPHAPNEKWKWVRRLDKSSTASDQDAQERSGR